jgi:hypothetical protein
MTRVGFVMSALCPVRGQLWKCSFAVGGVAPDVIQAPNSTSNH